MKPGKPSHPKGTLTGWQGKGERVAGNTLQDALTVRRKRAQETVEESAFGLLLARDRRALHKGRHIRAGQRYGALLAMSLGHDGLPDLRRQ